MTSFESLDLIEPIQRALAEENYVTPTPIQAAAIPPLLEGKDVFGCAQTGTGKTAAFLLPTLQKLAATPQSGKPLIRALVLTPTRELAAQIGESFESYSRYLPLRHRVIFGGVNQRPQVSDLRRGIDVLVATPGRLLDLHGQGHIDLGHVEFFVLDEADRMLDMGFIHDIRRILKVLPGKRQNLLFSATMPASIIKLASGFLTDPIKVEVDRQSTTVETIVQQVMFVDKGNKKWLLRSLLEGDQVESAIVFTRTKHGANRVVKELARSDIEAAAIHGNKSQGARTRALAGFKSGTVRVLVATDIASRGIDVDGVSHVFNYDLPNIAESYVHRIGRTGRAGKEGVAIAFCDESESDYLRDIERLTGTRLEVVDDHEWHFPRAMPSNQSQNRKPRPQNAGSGNRNTGRGGHRRR
jgi:ATP-dependent RNA helicase RhlE